MIEFDHRDDGGPKRVGIFPDRGAALDHITHLGLADAVWSVVHVTHPEDDHGTPPTMRGHDAAIPLVQALLDEPAPTYPRGGIRYPHQD